MRASLLSSRTSVEQGPNAAIREFNAQQSRMTVTGVAGP
jgi:hypothetical protein